MILADKILTHRKKNGWSQEELAEKLGVSRQSVSKWESAASIPDIGKIIELAALFGVTTDYLLKDSEEEPRYTDLDETDKRPRVSVAEANEFIRRSAAHGRRIAIGVVLCLLSPVTVILLAGLNESNPAYISEKIVAGFGVTAMFALVAAGVAAFILGGADMRRFEYLRSGDFVLEYGVAGIVNEKRGAHDIRSGYSVAAGTALSIMSVTPLIIAGVSDASEDVLIFLTALMFFILALAVYLFITAAAVMNSYNRLLKDREFKPVEIQKNKVIGRIAGAYWPIITAIYLGWSFWTGSWNITWIVWPVAALLFSGIAAAFGSKDRNN